MIRTAHTIRDYISVLLLSVLLLAGQPFITTAQEPVEDVVAPKAIEDLTNPYPIEALLGDKVLGDFVLGPGKVELEIAPGESKTIEITVSNRIGKTQRFDLEVEDMTGSNDASRAVVLLGDDTGPYTLKDYISIPKMSFNLEHNMRTRIPVTISIPADAEPGGRYGSVLVTTVTKPAGGGDDISTTPTSAVVSRIGALFFITIPGDAEISGELKDFSTVPKKAWHQGGPIDFQILYENTGSVHLNPYGEIQITNILGEEVGVVELEPWFAMPGSLRLREVSWGATSRELPLFGKYTATLQLNRGYDDVIDVMEYSFWVLPWKHVLAAIAVVFIVVFLLRAFFRNFEFKRKGNI